MPFPKFTNPYLNPTAVPLRYRAHPYVRPAEDPVTIWAITILVEDYNVPLDAPQLELSADFSEGTH